jgi:hypothetical protein
VVFSRGGAKVRGVSRWVFSRGGAKVRGVSRWVFHAVVKRVAAVLGGFDLNQLNWVFGVVILVEVVDDSGYAVF